jgi:hypothetical protein
MVEQTRIDDDTIKAKQDAFDAIEAGVLKLYHLKRLFEEKERPREPEYVRRKQALAVIHETLGFRPLSAYSATHLELLNLLLCYWRECEDFEGAEFHAPAPERAQ